MDRVLVARVMKAAIILHNMVVKARRDGYKSELWPLAKKAVEMGLFIDEHRESQKFQWNRYADISVGDKPIKSSRWSSLFCNAQTRVKNATLHYSLKMDLTDHI